MEKQQKVLVADDEAQIRNILSIYLKKAGFEVVKEEENGKVFMIRFRK